ncbi:protein of unknown function [Acidithiobacillus ferrivorans]|uniref:Uncharacterized protein n=1 Tax=Acidithiobacillus ferrivorans TaxID=160808 RepID=A0A060UQS4_9PROT|nr:hypothetical protein AFERRI_400412 [Acidithiobacillus ferrivorans]SMH64660.1 protein of unknown function [Acidithiobacillus ferrivorans]
MQGRQTQARVPGQRLPFIPARAGQTLPAMAEAVPVSFHPCACRADQSGSTGTTASFLSSLRVQGRRILPGFQGTAIPFIPARAGQTDEDQRDALMDAFHPCACRADVGRNRERRTISLSSLRVQG